MMTGGTNTTAPLGIMGGAFDPVHSGHLRCALEIQEAAGLGEVRLIPSANPPHRPPHFAPPALRVRMLEAAVAEYPAVLVDQRELQRQGTSWTVDTLGALRAEYPERSLVLILGMDAFLGLPDWRDWEQLPELAHIVVARRPGSELTPQAPLAGLLNERLTNDPAHLHSAPAGRVLVHDVTQLEISSSAIRGFLAAGQPIDFLVPRVVRDIIAETNCYASTLPKERSTHAQ